MKTNRAHSLQITITCGSLLFGGCYSPNKSAGNSAPYAFTKNSSVSGGSAATLGNGQYLSNALPAPGSSNEVYQQQQKDRADLSDAYGKADAYVQAQLDSISATARGSSKLNVAIIGGGILAGIASTVFTASNPAKHAAWIAGTTGAATGALTFRNDRALEGFSAQAAAEQYARVRDEIAAARAEYANARLAMENDDINKWNYNYQKTSNAIDRLRSAGQLKGIPIGNASDNAAINDVMKQFLDEIKSVRLALQPGTTPSQKQQASDGYVSAITDQKVATDAATAAKTDEQKAKDALNSATQAVSAADAAKSAAKTALDAYVAGNAEPPPAPEAAHTKWTEAKKKLEDKLGETDANLISAKAGQQAAQDVATKAATASTAAAQKSKDADKQVELTKNLLEAAIALDLSKPKTSP